MRQDEVNARALEGLTGEAKEAFLEGLRILGISDPTDRMALREAIRKLRPDFTEQQLDTFVDGEVKPEPDWDLTGALVDN